MSCRARLADQPGLVMVVQVTASKTSLAQVRSLVADGGQEPGDGARGGQEGTERLVNPLPNRCHGGR
jgi:hypothetical protein